MRKVSDLLARIALGGCAVALGLMVVVVTYQILGRYVSFIPRAIWTEEISRMCLMWLIFLGAAAGVRAGEHFIVDLVSPRFGLNVKRVILTGCCALILLAAAALVLGSVGFVQTGMGRTSTTSQMSLVWSFLAPLVSSILMVVFTVQVWLESIKDPDAVDQAPAAVTEVLEEVP